MRVCRAGGVRLAATSAGPASLNGHPPREDHCGQPIVDVDFLLDGGEAEFVRAFSNHGAAPVNRLI
jgi:hypothetical protein